MFFKIGVLKNFAIYTAIEHLWWLLLYDDGFFVIS